MKPNLTTCPICGARRLKLLRSDFVLKAGRRSPSVPKLERYECPACGEILFDYEGVNRIELARGLHRTLARSA